MFFILVNLILIFLAFLSLGKAVKALWLSSQIEGNNVTLSWEGPDSLRDSWTGVTYSWCVIVDGTVNQSTHGCQVNTNNCYQTVPLPFFTRSFLLQNITP